MDSAELLCLSCPGAICSVGTSLAEIASATNAGLRRLTVDERLSLQRDGWPVAAGRVAGIDAIDGVVDRMIELGRHALSQCLATRPEVDDDLPPLPILLAVPGPRPGLDDEMSDWLVSNILADAGSFDRERSGAVRAGHDGFLALIEAAGHLLRNAAVHACVIGAVDSGIDRAYVAWLEELRRLHGRGQPHGMAPGEAAAFCILQRVDRAQAEQQGRVAIGTPARTQEPRPWYLNQATMGEGLTFALRHALADRGVDACYSDLNGEHWRATEWDYAYLRNGQLFGHPLDLRHPAQAWGDVGTASGALLTLLATWDLHQGRCGHRSALICTSSDTQPTRAAMRLDLLTPPQAKTP